MIFLAKAKSYISAESGSAILAKGKSCGHFIEILRWLVAGRGLGMTASRHAETSYLTD